MDKKKIKRQLVNLRRKELYLAKSIRKCPQCQVNGITILEWSHPVLLWKRTYRDELCPYHARRVDRFNHKYASD